jgi:hypothetical protein
MALLTKATAQKAARMYGFFADYFIMDNICFVLGFCNFSEKSADLRLLVFCELTDCVIYIILKLVFCAE